MDKKKTRRSSARRRKRQVRLRWDRIFMVLIVPALLIIFAVICIRGCDGSDPETPAAPVAADAPAHVPPVADVALRDAAAVTSHAPESMERQDALLRIHARHSALRRHGFNAAADEYITTVNKYLTDHGGN